MATDQPKIVAVTPAKPKKRRWFLKFVILCFLLLIGLVLLAPTLISSGPGTSFALSFVNNAIPGSVEVEDLSVGWFSGTKVQGMTLRDPDGKIIAHADIDAPSLQLLSAVRGNRALGEITINATQFDIIQYEDGSTNLDRAFGPSKEKPRNDDPVTIPSNLSVKLHVTAPKITYSAPKMEQAVVSNLDVLAEITSPQSISAAIKAGVEQGKYKGSIDGKALVKDLFDSAGVMQASKGDVDAAFALNNLPTDMVGSLAKQGDKLTVLAGPDLTTKISAKGRLTDLAADLSVVAERLSIQTKTSIALSDDFKLKKLTTKDGTLLQATITPLTHATWVRAGGRLKNNFDVTVTQENVALIGGASGFDLNASTGRLKVAVQPVRLETGTPDAPQTQELIINDITIAYDGPKGLATALIDAVARQGDKSGTLVVKVDLNKPLDAKGRLNYETLDGTIDAQLKEFAIGVVDDFMGTQGLLVSLLGDKLDAGLLAKVKPTPDGKGGKGNITLVAKSANKLDVNLKAQVIAVPVADAKPDGPAFDAFASLTEPGSAKLSGAQQTLTTLARRYPGLKELADKLKADESADITVTITELSAPLDGTLMKKAKAQLALNVGAATLDLNQPEQKNPDLIVRIDSTNATLNYAGEANKAVLTADIKTTAANKPGKLAANITVNNLLNKEGKVDTAGLAPVIVAEVVDLPMVIADAFVGKGRLAHYGVGPVLNATVTTTVTQVAGAEGKNAVAGPVKIVAKAENLDVLIDARLEGGRFTLVDPSKSYINVTATPALLTELTNDPTKPAAEKPRITLAAPSKVRLTFSQLDIPLDAELMKKNGRIGLTATIDQLVTKGDDRLADAAMRNVVATLAPTTLDQPLVLTVKGDLLQGTAKGAIDVNATVTRAMEDNRRINAKATLTSIPTALLDALGGQGGLLVDLFGPSIEAVALTLNQGEGDSMLATYDIRSTLATGTGGATIVAGKSATTSANTTLKITLSPQAFASLQQKHGDKLPAMLKDVVLVESTTVDVVIERAQFALAPLPAESTGTAGTTKPTQAAPAAKAEPSKPLPINAAGSSFKANITTKGPFIGKKDFASSLRFDNVKMVVETPKNMSEIAIALDAETSVIPMVGNAPQTVDTTKIQKGSVNAKINAFALADKDGRVTFANVGPATLIVDATAKNLPVDVADRLLDLGGKLLGAIGPTITDLNVKSRKDGDLVARMVSANADVNVTGLYTDQVRLTDSAVAKLYMNEMVSSLVFEPLTGGVFKAEKSEKPVVITVGKDGFALPLTDFDISKVSAKVDFDFNSMKLKPLISVDNLIPAGLRPLMLAAGVDGLLESELAGFLGKFDRNMPTFGPFSATIDKGMLTYDKPMTFVMDKFTIALDGRVNLKTKVPQMSFGFPKALFSSKIQRFIGSEGYFFVPFTQNKEGKLVPDSSAFGEIIKQSFNPAKLLGGAGGDKPDIGSIIGNVLGGKDKDKKDPPKAPTPPTTPVNPTIPAPATPTPTTPAPTTPSQPDLGTVIGDLLNRNKDKSKAKPPAVTPETKSNTNPPATPTPVAPPEPARPVGFTDAGKKMLNDLSVLRSDRARFMAKLDELATSGDIQALYAVTHAVITVPHEAPFKAGKQDSKEPKWAAYARMKRMVDSDGFADLGAAYVRALEKGNADKQAATLVQWITDRETRLKWSKNQWVVTK